MAISANIGVLHNVFNFCVIAQNGAANTVKTLVIATHNDFVKSTVSCADAVHDLFIAQCFRSLKGFSCFHGVLILIESVESKRLQPLLVSPFSVTDATELKSFA